MNSKRNILASFSIIVLGLAFSALNSTIFAQPYFVDTIENIIPMTAEFGGNKISVSIGLLISSVLLPLIFIKGYEKKGILEGVRFGLIFGLLLGFGPPIRATLASFPFPVAAITPYLAYLVIFIIEMIILGILLALIYKTPEETAS